MSAIAIGRHGWRPRWDTTLVGVSVAVVLLSFLLFPIMPLMVTTVTAVAGGTGFVIGVSASISAFLDRESYADSDFWR